MKVFKIYSRMNTKEELFRTIKLSCIHIRKGYFHWVIFLSVINLELNENNLLAYLSPLNVLMVVRK